MKITSNVHTHTTYCDGTASVEAFIEEAIAKELKCIGFSGHSYMPVGDEYAMSLSGTAEYIEEIRQAKKRYQGRIQILLGIEWDGCSRWQEYGQGKSPVKRSDFDYLIGSIHTLQGPQTGEYYALDYLPEMLEACIREGFGGDVQGFVQAYYHRVVTLFQCEKPTIIGHFDLLTKLNGTSVFFDEQSSYYQHAAMDALETLVQQGAVFEINTGGIYRGYRKVPYPDTFLLQRLHELNGTVLLSSDAHEPSGLTFLFEEMEKELKEMGFREIVQLTETGFETVAL